MVQSNRAQFNLKRRLAQTAIGLFDHPALIGLKALVKSGPLRGWAQRQQWKMKLAMGVRLVPEHALSEKFHDALMWLRQQEDMQSLGDYLEFGVFNGTSLSCMHSVLQAMKVPNMRLFGFDSFEGLPESAAIDGWQPGSFQIDYKYARRWLTNRGVDWERVTLVKGWFSETLNQSLIDRYQIKRASVIMIDCDAYASAKEALAFCAPLIGERAALFFDDWYPDNRAQQGIGEKLALDEFLSANPELVVEDFGNYNENSQVFKVIRSNEALI